MKNHPRIRMYKTAACPYCERALQLLRCKGVTEVEEIRIDQDPQKRDEMMQITGKRTVPQIFIGEHYVGGCDDLYELEQAGGLDTLLFSSPA